MSPTSDACHEWEEYNWESICDGDNHNATKGFILEARNRNDDDQCFEKSVISQIEEVLSDESDDECGNEGVLTEDHKLLELYPKKDVPVKFAEYSGAYHSHNN